MNKIVAFVSFCFLFVVTYSQKEELNNCLPIKSKNSKLFLDGTNNSLIDNALRCFDLNSIGTYRDSCTRIWIYEDDALDTPLIYRVKMFQFGSKKKKEYAFFYTLEWIVRGDDLVVTRIRKDSVTPTNGWRDFENKIQTIVGGKISPNPSPLMLPGGSMVDVGMVILQYVTENVTTTIDYTTRSDLGKSEFKSIKQFSALLKTVQREFRINLTRSQNGLDLLDPHNSDISVDKKF